jgi:hypothetical protein
VATNFYFNNFTNSQEQHLIEDLVTESIKIYGHDVYYLPRTLVARDSLYNQDDLSTFDSAYLVDMYIKNVEGFEGEGDLFQRFGVEIRDQITFVISQRTFDLEISGATSLIRPNEGDLIFLPLNNKPFEIKFVEHEAVFYQMGSLQTYEMTCELYEYSGERFNTGITSIDNIENLNAPSTQIYVENVTGNYVIDETVYVSLPLIAGEQATASLTPSVSSGQVSITIANGGIGYASNTLITVSPPDTEEANLTFNFVGGSLSSVDVNDGGGFFSSAPTITISPPNANSNQATANSYVTDGIVTEIELLDQGQFYVDPPGATVTVALPPDGNTSNRATATATVTGGKVTSISLVSGGDGYYEGAPDVTISAPIGSLSDFQASAAATLTDGIVTSVSVTNSGQFYDGTEDITIDAPTSATARARMDVNGTGVVSGITILDAGNGYRFAPTLTIPAPANNVVKATVAKITANTSESGSYTLELNNLAANTNTLQFSNSQILIGATSGASGTILDGNQTEETFDEEAQNEFFESEGDNILDFTDRDPFSEGGTF